MVDHKAEDLARMKRWAKNATYVSNLSVDSYIQAIYQTVCYGMWKEMCSTVTIQDESPVFVLMIDTATTLKTYQHVAVGVKYISLDAKEFSECVLAVNGFKDKSSEGLVNTIKVVVNNFNDVIANLWESCPWLFRFEKDRNLSLKLNSCSSYCSDGRGGCRSKYISANQRLKVENPRLLDFWCAPYRSHKVVEHASKTTDFGERHLTTSAQVQELFTVSAESYVMHRKPLGKQRSLEARSPSILRISSCTNERASKTPWMLK